MSHHFNRAWETYVERVVLHVADYLDYDGRYSPGGRQRYVCDLAHLIIDRWGKQVLIVQKAHRDFEKVCQDGLHVIGVKSAVKAYGDPAFSRRVKALLKPTDGLIYASGEDGWPFFTSNAKAIQHGVWWDGPQQWYVRYIQKIRALATLESVRSMACVDTNFINWLRCQGKRGLALSSRCIYIPNYVDLPSLRESKGNSGHVLRLICARRFDAKRGLHLFLDALDILKRKSCSFSAVVCSNGGRKEIERTIETKGLSAQVTVRQDSMSEVLTRYAEADVAVVPTIWSEGTSFACIEAICAGVPVVVTPVGGLGNLVIPEFNGLIVGANPQAIACAVQRFYDKRLWSEMNRNCLSMRHALSRDRWQRQILSWLLS